MVYKCCMPNCRGNYKNTPPVRVYRFPSDPELKKKWIVAIRRENFEPSKYSRVCELHFEPGDIIREASEFDAKTGRTLTAPLTYPRLRNGAVPTRCIPSPGPLVKKSTRSAKVKNRKGKMQPKEKTLKGGIEISDASQLQELLQTGTENNQENVTEPPITIKEEQVESPEQLQPPLTLNNLILVEELMPSSSNSSLSNSVPISSTLLPSTRLPFLINLQSLNSLSPSGNSSPSNNSSLLPENLVPAENPDSTILGKKVARNKLDRKRKINDVKSVDIDSTPSATTAKKHRRAKLPPSSSNRHSGTSKNSAGRSNPRIKGAEKTTREMFQSLLSGSENNPLFGSRTSERPGDLFDVFADFIADKLREMNWDSSAFALRSILDIVFNASQVKQSETDSEENVSNPDTSIGSPPNEE